MKFGVLPEHAGALLATAQDLGLNIVGVSFHVGSGCRESAVFYRAIAAAKDVSLLFIKKGCIVFMIFYQYFYFFPEHRLWLISFITMMLQCKDQLLLSILWLLVTLQISQTLLTIVFKVSLIVLWYMFSIFFQVFEEAIGIGFNPYLLDIGGGFPGTSNSSFDELVEYVNKGLDDFFPEGCGVEVMCSVVSKFKNELGLSWSGIWLTSRNVRAACDVNMNNKVPKVPEEGLS